MADPEAAIERGATADSPTQFSLTAWREILVRVWTNSGRHSLGFLAGGVAFFGFLSFVPALGLMVMLYGLFADPSVIFTHMMEVVRVFPANAAELINDQLGNLIKTANATRGWALVPAVAIALYGASGAASGITSSLNIVYEQDERRSFVRLTLVSFAMVAATLVVGLLGLVAASAIGLIETVVGELTDFATALVRVLTWLLTAAFASATFAAIYRYGPCRKHAKWRWLGLGSLLATVLWLLGSVLFGLYASLVGYDATYGSLGAVVALLMWFYISAYAVLLGAFVDAEAERQTSRDSTTGPEQPLGKRGAVVADTSAASGQ